MNLPIECDSKSLGSISMKTSRICDHTILIILPAFKITSTFSYLISERMFVVLDSFFKIHWIWNVSHTQNINIIIICWPFAYRYGKKRVNAFRETIPFVNIKSNYDCLLFLCIAIQLFRFVCINVVVIRIWLTILDLW